MPSEKENMLAFKHYMKSDKMPCIIYADIESLIKKIDGCENNSEKSSIRKVGKHIPCGYSVSTIWGFNQIEDKHTLYREQDCMKKICESLREHAKSIIDFEKKKNVTVNKKRIKITQRCKTMLYLQNKIFQKTL